jgi:hypothetical protein
MAREPLLPPLDVRGDWDEREIRLQRTVMEECWKSKSAILITVLYMSEPRSFHLNA